MNAKDKQAKSLDAKKTDVEIAGLSGPVMHVKQICYKARKRYNVEKGKVQHSGYKDEKNFTASFDENGHKTEEQVFSPWSRKKIMYNQHGQTIEEIHYYLDSDVMDDTAKKMSRETKKYDEQGHLLEHINYDGNGSITFKILSKYDDKPRLKNSAEQIRPSNMDGYGNMIEQCSYNGVETLTGKTIWLYDDKGHMQENIVYDTSGLPTTKCNWQYDDKDNMIEVTQYNAGVLTYKGTNEYVYDKQGNKLGYTAHNFYYAPGMQNSKNVFKCNDQGDIIEGNYYDSEGNLTESRSFTPEYDEQGNLINPWEDKPEEKLKSETEEFEYDTHGNWIKKITYYGISGINWKKVPVHLYLREISYWGEETAEQTSMEEFFADIKIQHDIEYPDETANNDIEKQETMKNKLTAEQAQWLTEGSPSPDSFNYMRYYTLINNEAPSQLTYSGPYIEAMALLNELKDNLDAKMIHSYSSDWNGQGESLNHYTLIFPEHPEYILHAVQISSQLKDEFDVPEFITEYEDYNEDDDYLYISPFHLLRPSEASGKRGKDDDAEEREFENELEDYITKCMLQKKPDKPTINIVEVRGNGFAMVEHAVDDDFVIKDLNLNYGEGFSNFHNELMHRFNTQTKGLVLFHGEPGTGKTYYIRHLLRQMTASNKVVVYMPPNMVEYLSEPNFMTFLQGEVAGWSEDGLFSVLLIEDAEPLLALRQHGARVQGITNLLNMSDGLLNDILNMQIICTFNVELEKLDDALLRPGRLIARKEFKRLPEFEANLLAQRLGIKHHFTAPATLSEIYGKAKNKNILVHDAGEHDAH